MELTWKFDQSGIDWNELSAMYKLAPLGNKSADHIALVFSNSRFCCFVSQDNRLVGAGRALADGLDTSYICDVAVHPDFQGLGIGKQIVQILIDQSEGHRKMILYANPGLEEFYAKLGFKKMNTAMAIFVNEEEMIQTGVISDD